MQQQIQIGYAILGTAQRLIVLIGSMLARRSSGRNKEGCDLTHSSVGFLFVQERDTPKLAPSKDLQF
jgi:hypothetical protein